MDNLNVFSVKCPAYPSELLFFFDQGKRYNFANEGLSKYWNVAKLLNLVGHQECHRPIESKPVYERSF